MIHVVKAQETIDEIAALYGVVVSELAYINQVEAPYPLAIGQALLIPSREDRQNLSPIVVSGYAYPFIREDILLETLPFLSELAVFSYGFTAEGDLLSPAIDPDWMLYYATAEQVQPILTLTPFDQNGKFNNQLIHALIVNEQGTQALYDNLLNECEQKGYAGIDVDFEYILAEDRQRFVDFVTNLTDIMNESGRQVSVALAPKTSSDQKGLLYEGKDYAGLGAAANQVLLMTYEWGYSRGPNMAVAPINKVREVVDYALTEIPAEKILLGMPNYGYDWPLPYERGVTVAPSIGNAQAVEIAIANSAEIQFDELAQSPFFRYVNQGVEHEVWFEDVRSIEAKFMLVKEYGLRGVGYWQLMRLFRANWYLLTEEFLVEKG